MPVVAQRAAQRECRPVAGGERRARAEIEPFLLEVDRDSAASFVRFAILVVVRDRHAVAAVVEARGGAELPAFADEARARAAGLRPAPAVPDFSLHLLVPSGFVFVLLQRAQASRLREPRDLVVVRVPPGAVDVQRQRPDAGVESACRGFLAQRRVAADLDESIRRVVHVPVQAVRHDVDEAAGRAAAVQEGRRPAQDFDLVRKGRIDCDRVILGQARCVEHREPVGQHADTIAAEAPDDRP